MTKRRLAAALILCLALTAAHAGDRTKETRVFEIGTIVAKYEEPVVDVLGPVRGGLYDCWSEDDPTTSFMNGDDLVSLIEGAGLFGNGHEIRVVGQRLHVRADAEDLPGVEALLREVGRAATRRVEVEIRLLAAPPGFEAPAAVTLDAPAVDRLVERVREAGGTVRDANTVSRPARRTSAGHVSVRSYVRDMSVEIAGGTEVGDPRVEWIREGWRVDVRPQVLDDGGVFLETLLQISRLVGPVRRVDLEAHELGAVELPSLSRRLLFAAGRVESGRWMAITQHSTDGVRILLLRPSISGRAASRRIATSTEPTPAVGYRMEWAEDGDAEGSPTRADAADQIPPLRPPRLRVTTNESRSKRTVPVLVRVMSGKREIASARLPVVPGRDQCVSDGILRSYVADWSVEVASEGARIGDPEVEWAWGGTALTFRLDAGPDPDVFAVRILGEVATLSPTFETKRPGNTVTGVIESPTGRTVAIDADAVLTAGRTHRIRPSGDVTVEITVGK